ncbi:hypothetical protein Hanom_Chr03g00274431 [Helianthus anomalus]
MDEISNTYSTNASQQVDKAYLYKVYILLRFTLTQNTQPFQLQEKRSRFLDPVTE